MAVQDRGPTVDARIGVHDMGGKQGFGAVAAEEEHLLSRSDWRGRMFGIGLAATRPPATSDDWIRHLSECIPPAVYLACAYYDRWYRETAADLLNAGWASLDELKSGKASGVPARLDPPLSPAAVPAALRGRTESKRPDARPAAFARGDAVRASGTSSLGHTRLPGYLRGHVGRIEACYGWHLLPDAVAKGEARAEPLYCVGFLARDLWDEVTAPKDRVYADLWESYLGPA